jgi:hypothetical protein
VTTTAPVQTQFTGDSSGVQRAVDGVIGKFDRLSTKSKRLEAALGDVTRVEKLTEAQLAALRAEAARTESAIDRLTGAAQAQAGALNTAGGAAKNTGAGLNAMQGQLGGAVGAVNGLSSALGESASSAASAVNAFKGMGGVLMKGGVVGIAVAAATAAIALYTSHLEKAEKRAESLIKTFDDLAGVSIGDRDKSVSALAGAQNDLLLKGSLGGDKEQNRLVEERARYGALAADAVVRQLAATTRIAALEEQIKTATGDTRANLVAQIDGLKVQEVQLRGAARRYGDIAAMLPQIFAEEKRISDELERRARARAKWLAEEEGFRKRIAALEGGPSDVDFGMKNAGAVLGGIRRREQDRLNNQATPGDLASVNRLVGFAPGDGSVVDLDQAAAAKRLKDAYAEIAAGAHDFRGVTKDWSKVNERIALTLEGASRKFEQAFSAEAIAGMAMMLGAGGGQAGGQELGRIAGGAIGSIFGSAELGSMVGGVVGSIAGNLLDEIVVSLQVLTPLFDGVAVVIAGLQPILMVFREVAVAVGAALAIGLAPVVLQLSRIMASTLGPVLLFCVRVVLSVVIALLMLAQYVLSLGELFVAVMGPIDQALTFFANGLVWIVNGMIDGLNTFNTAIRVLVSGLGAMLARTGIPGLTELGEALKDAAGVLGVTFEKMAYFDTLIDQFSTGLGEAAGVNEEALGANTAALEASFGAENTNLPTGFKLALAEYSTADGEAARRNDLGMTQGAINFLIEHWHGAGSFDDEITRARMLSMRGSYARQNAPSSSRGGRN